jgi:hypothetical protein
MLLRWGRTVLPASLAQFRLKPGSIRRDVPVGLFGPFTIIGPLLVIPG